MGLFNWLSDSLFGNTGTSTGASHDDGIHIVCDSSDSAVDTSQMNDEPDVSRCSINPATGLPMISDDCSGVDVGGNPFGTNLNDAFDSSGLDSYTSTGLDSDSCCVSSIDDPISGCGFDDSSSGCSSFDDWSGSSGFGDW